MVMEETNITFTNEELIEMAQKVINNTATAKDYDNLDNFLNTFGLTNYLKDKFKELNIFEFDSFVSMRKGMMNSDDLRKESRLVGVVLGAIEAIKKVL